MSNHQTPGGNLFQLCLREVCKAAKWQTLPPPCLTNPLWVHKHVQHMMCSVIASYWTARDRIKVAPDKTMIDFRFQMSRCESCQWKSAELTFFHHMHESYAKHKFVRFHTQNMHKLVRLMMDPWNDSAWAAAAQALQVRAAGVSTQVPHALTMPDNNQFWAVPNFYHYTFGKGVSYCVLHLNIFEPCI